MQVFYLILLLSQHTQSHLQQELLVLLLLICLQNTTKHPVTGPQFVYVCLRWKVCTSEPSHMEPRVGLQGNVRQGLRELQVHEAELQSLRIYDKNANCTCMMRRGGGLGQCLWIFILPEVRGRTPHQHREQTSITLGHLEKPASQHLSALGGNHQNMTFLSNPVFVFPWESWEILDRLHVLTALYLMQRLPQKRTPSSCDRAQGQPPFPWCSCSSPCPLGVWRARFDWTGKRDRNGVGVTRQKKRDICFSSWWENSPDPGD